MGPASAFLSLAGGFAVAEIWKKVSPAMLLFGFFAVCFTAFAYPLDTYDKYEPYLYHGDTVRTSMSGADYMFQGTDSKKLNNIKPEVPEQGIEILEYEKNGGNVTMTVSAQPGSYVDTTILYFTGHKAFDQDGNQLPSAFGVNNRMRVQFPEAYEGEVTVCYDGFFLWHVCDMISLVSVLALIISLLGKNNLQKVIDSFSRIKNIRR